MSKLKLVHSQPEEKVQIMVEMRPVLNWPILAIIIIGIALDVIIIIAISKGLSTWLPDQSTNIL